MAACLAKAQPAATFAHGLAVFKLNAVHVFCARMGTFIGAAHHGKINLVIFQICLRQFKRGFKGKLFLTYGEIARFKACSLCNIESGCAAY